nr:helix-turn-helix transcriptional regulator [Cellulomonas sp. APG4]
MRGVGPRLRELRTRQGMTLAEVGRVTGISVSTLSRLEQGGRRATLELLLPLARAYDVTLDELVAPSAPPDPRVHTSPLHRQGRVYLPLTTRPGAPGAYKIIIAPEPSAVTPELRTHEGYEWVYVLSGRLRLLLGGHDLVLAPSEAAEFDTRTPHWLGCDGDQPVELLALFGPQGERTHVRARPRSR